MPAQGIMGAQAARAAFAAFKKKQECLRHQESLYPEAVRVVGSPMMVMLGAARAS